MAIRRGLLMAMAGSSYKKIYSGEVTVNTDSTTAIIIEEIDIGASSYTSDKLLYVKIRDKAGKRAGYFYGSDSFCANPYPAISSTTTSYGFPKYAYRHTSDNQTLIASDSFGVFPQQVTSAGILRINARYSATTSLTINGTYSIDVYLLDWPDNDSPFN